MKRTTLCYCTPSARLVSLGQQGVMMASTFHPTQSTEYLDSGDDIILDY